MKKKLKIKPKKNSKKNLVVLYANEGGGNTENCNSNGTCCCNGTCC